MLTIENFIWGAQFDLSVFIILVLLYTMVKMVIPEFVVRGIVRFLTLFVDVYEWVYRTIWGD